MEYEEDIAGKYKKITRMISENIIIAVVIFSWNYSGSHKYVPF